jgi:hypothetical protein
MLALAAGAGSAFVIAQTAVDGVPDIDCDNRNVHKTALFVKVTPVRAKPDATSTLVATAPAGSLYAAPCREKGWVRVIQPDGKHRGWARVPADDLIDDDWQSTLLRKERAAKSTWSPSVKRYMIRKVVRIGFTVSQVEATLGAPIQKEAGETSAGSTEVWSYGRIGMYWLITMKKGVVTAAWQVESLRSRE